MIYSKSCEYAIRALSYLAGRKGDDYSRVSEISRETGISRSYIAKIFQRLVKTGILKSEKGARGGFAFGRPPETISLFHVVKVVDDISGLQDDCVMGLNRCSSVNPCPLHPVWMKSKENILNGLCTMTLKQMTKEIARLKFRKLKRSRLL